MFEKKKLEFGRLHTFTGQELLRRITELALDMADQFHLDMEWRSDRVLGFWSTKGMTKGLEGTLHLDSTQVRMVLLLPFGLQPMEQTIREEVNQYLDQNVSPYGT